MPVHADVGVAKDDAVEPRIGNEAAVPDDADSEALGNRLAKRVAAFSSMRWIIDVAPQVMLRRSRIQVWSGIGAGIDAT